MSNTQNFKLGLFVVVALIILVGVLLIFGPGGFWQEKARMETYLDESAQGLDVGSAVKMRGVQIGNIENISFVAQKYPQAAMDKRYVLVEINVRLKNLPVQNRAELAEYMQQEVQDGLRIRILPQGLTGTAYLELDYFQPERHPEPEISWQPDNIYIPSAPGTIARLEETFESMDKTLTSLEAVDWAGTFQRLDLLLTSLQKQVSDFPSLEIGDQTQALLREIRHTNRQLGNILGHEHEQEIPGGNLQEMIAQVNATASELEDLLSALETSFFGPEGGLVRMNSMLKNLDQASKNMPELMESFGRSADHAESGLQEFNYFLSSHGSDLAPALRDLSATMRNLRELSNELKNYPGSIFRRPEPGQRRYLHD